MSIHRICERVDSTEKILSERTDKPELSFITMPDLNDKLWGLKRKQISLIAGRTSIGKSSFALQMAWDLAKQFKKVLYFSLEMDIENLVERLFCNEHKIDNYRLISGKFKEYEYYWNRFKEDLKDKIFVLSDICGKTWKEVDEILRNLIEKPDVIFIDHINHIKTQGGKEKESIDEYLINMQALAIEHNVSIVIVAQINRTALDAKNPIPELHQLKGSGCLEEICGVAILLHWEWKYDNNKPREVYKVIVAKNRNGRTGFVEMRFEPEYYKFSKYEKPKEPQVKKKSKFQQVELSEVQSEVQPEVAWDE